MRIDFELPGFCGYGWKMCNRCPVRHVSETGGWCGLKYFESDYYVNGLLNLDTGATIKGRYAERPDDGCRWYHVWLRPQECIKAHGR